ncbi:MAG: MarR family winged helix-turn-helix transcriptional regulator [Acidimicrobiales bacterium]
MAKPSDADPLVDACITGLLRAEARVSATIEENLRRHDISAAGFNVLMILAGNPGPMCPREISDRRLVTRGAITGVLRSLEDRSLVRRTRHPDDRRMQLIELSPAGTRLLDELLPEHRRRECALVARLSERDRSSLARLLGKIGNSPNRREVKA